MVSVEKREDIRSLVSVELPFVVLNRVFPNGVVSCQQKRLAIERVAIYSRIFARTRKKWVRACFDRSVRVKLPCLLPTAFSVSMRKNPDLIRRHTLAYMLCSISELFRHYDDFDPLDLLIVHAILNANVINVMKSPELDQQFGSMEAVEPDEIKLGVSRAALSRFLSLPVETIRRRVAKLKKRKIISEGASGLIISEKNAFKFGNNHALQTTNVVLVRKLLRDQKRAGIDGPDDL